MGGPGSGPGVGTKLKYPRATARELVVSHAIVDKRVSRRELSRRAGISAGQGSEILAGHRSVWLGNGIAQKYAELLGQPLEILFTIEQEPTRPAQPRPSRPRKAKRAVDQLALTGTAGPAGTTEPAGEAKP